jgi:signal transduction histidine kinase
MSDLRSEEPIFKIAHAAMLVLFSLLLSLVLLTNPEQRTVLAGGYSLYFVLTLFRHFFLPGEKNRFWQMIFPYLEGLVIYLTIGMEASISGLSILTLIVWDIALDYPYTYGGFYAFAGYVAYMTIYIRNMPPLPMINILLLLAIAAFQILLYVGFAFLARSYSMQSRRLRQTAADLQAKMITTEEMTTLRERNRIAMEIHNTVGHQLTTALVQIEAAQMIFDQDPQESQRRMGISKEQVQMGLQQLRKTVSSINADQDYDDFAGAVASLLEQVHSHTPVTIDASLDDIQNARLQIKKTLYHMILETITNAIRHGKGRRIKIRLERAEDRILLSCHNDGALPKRIQFGFGLNKIEEQLKELGGTLSIQINEEGWFGLEAQIPIAY